VKLDFDPYAVLEVPHDASLAQIAQAKRRQSRKYHPDLNSSLDAAQRFDEVQRAAALLSSRQARADYDRERASTAEAAPGVTVHPTSVDFGVLQAGQPGREAAVTVSWTGAPPGRIACTPGNEWWTSIRADMPDSSAVSFVLRAQAHVGIGNGRLSGQFAVTIDGQTIGVALTATVRGVPGRPQPGTIPSARTPPVPPARRPAPATRPRPARPAARFIYTVVLALTLGLIFIGHAIKGGGQAIGPVPAPPPQPVTVPQSASAAAARIQPVFRVSPTLSADLRFGNRGSGIVAAPVLHGLELVVEVAPSAVSLGGDCIDVLPAGGASADAGGAYSEYPVNVEWASGSASGPVYMTYPAILPGAYSFDESCYVGSGNLNYSGASIGAVSMGNLGVVGGGDVSAPFANAMVVYSVHTSAAGTVVVYGAVGNSSDGPIPPPADSACIDNGAGNQWQRYWQPSQALVGEHADAKQEWYETGSLIFRGISAGSPGNLFYYDCDYASSQYDPAGISLP
jgi:hypothetical protein